MSPRKFLYAIGWALLIFAVIGFLVRDSWGEFWNFTPLENWGHLFAGAIALILVRTPKLIVKAGVVLLGVLALILAIWGFGKLETPDNLIHLIIGISGLWAGFVKLKKKEEKLPTSDL